VTPRTAAYRARSRASPRVERRVVALSATADDFRTAMLAPRRLGRLLGDLASAMRSLAVTAWAAPT